jgi:hypothetical protein
MLEACARRERRSSPIPARFRDRHPDEYIAKVPLTDRGHAARPGHAGLTAILLAAGLASHAWAVERSVGDLRALSSPAGPGSAEPRLAVAPSGRVLMSWLEQRPDSGHRLRMAWLEGKRWSAPFTIAEGDSFFANWADFPSVLPLDDRRLVAHWLWKVSGDTYGYHVRTARSVDGGRTWSPQATLHADTSATEHGFVSLVATGEDGMAVWLDGHNFKGHGEGHGAGPDMTVRSARFTAAGIVDEQEVDARACDCCQTAAVTTSRGVLVAYRDRSPEEVRDISLARFADGRWTPPYPLHADRWNIAGCPVNGPDLAAAGDDVAVAWFTAARETAKVNVAFSADGGERFGSPIRVDLGSPEGRVGIALLADRSALVTWLEQAGKEGTIHARRVSRQGEASAPMLVARTSIARASGFPQVAMSGDRVIFAWTEAGKPSRVRLATGAIELR